MMAVALALASAVHVGKDAPSAHFCRPRAPRQARGSLLKNQLPIRVIARIRARKQLSHQLIEVMPDPFRGRVCHVHRAQHRNDRVDPRVKYFGFADARCGVGSDPLIFWVHVDAAVRGPDACEPALVCCHFWRRSGNQ